MRNLKITYAVSVITLILIICSPSIGQNPRTSQYVVSYNSFGPVKIGMTVSQATKALGVPLVREDVNDASCYYVTPKQGFKDVSFMVTNGRVARVDIERGYATERGAKVGDTEARIKQLYKGRVKVSKHFYTDGHYLEVKSGRFSIIFETDGKRVIYIRAGKNPEVGYVEGCS